LLAFYARTKSNDSQNHTNFVWWPLEMAGICMILTADGSQPAQGRTVTWAYFFTRKVNCPSLRQPGKGWTDVIFTYIGISIISALKLLSNFLIENKPWSHHHVDNNEVNNGAIAGPS
jgi:hypothetical protein